jgi:hypothetical protein
MVPAVRPPIQASSQKRRDVPAPTVIATDALKRW